MSGGDSGFTHNFKAPEMPSIAGPGKGPTFDASAFQSGASHHRAYSMPMETASLTFTPLHETHTPLRLADATSGPVSTGDVLPVPSLARAADIPSKIPSLTADNTAALTPEQKLEPGKAPNVTVQFSDQPKDMTSTVAPTVVIDKAGKLLDANGQPFDGSALDFKQGVPKDIVVQLQHDANDPAATATDAQKQALNGFLQNQLNPALRQINDAAAEQGVQLDDTTGQVQKEVAQKLATAQPPEAPQPEMAPQTRQAVQNINNDMPSDNQQHSMPARQANNYFSHADVPKGQDNSVTAEKDMLAALESNKENPYETIHQRGDNSYSVGRYGNSWNQFNNYLMMALTPEMLALLGNPPDYSKLGQLLKEHPEMLKQLQANMSKLEKDGKIPHSFADRFKSAESAEHFGNFVDKLHGNKGPLTADEIKQNFPKEMQEAMATDFVKRGIANGATPGKMALANQLGKNPEDLTATDINDPKNKEFMQAATKYYALASARQNAHPDDNIDYQVSNDPNMTDIRMRIARAAGSHVTGGSGYCARSAQQDLAEADPRLRKYVGSGNAWDMGQHMLRTGEWKQIDPQKAGPGDAIFFHDPNYYGDVQLIKSRRGDTYTAANDHWNTDNVNGLGNKSHRRNAYSNYDRSIVLRYVGKDNQDA